MLCRVKLCGIQKKIITGLLNLHKLPEIKYEALLYQSRNGRNGDGMGNKTLFPVPAVSMNDMADGAFVNGIVAF